MLESFARIRARTLSIVVLVAGVSLPARAERPSPPSDPDVFSAVVMRAVAPETAPVRGDDGKIHVVYELWLTNVKTPTATIEQIEVLDADDRTRVLASFAGAALAGAVFHLNAKAAPLTLAQDESRVVFVQLAFDRPSDVPDALVHRLTGTAAASPSAQTASAISYVTALYPLDHFTPPVIGAPLHGTGWVATNGCCQAFGAHRSALQSVNGRLDNSQRFAIDFLKLDDLGRFVVGDPSDVHHWVCYDEPVLAVDDGVVMASRNDLDDQPVGQLPPPSTITVENALGNFAVLDIGHGFFVFFAHMRKGTVKVKPGDRVRQGQELGRLGNSGNTSAPHLHMHVMNGPSALGASGLPFVYRAFKLTGFIDSARWDAAPDLTGTWGNRGSFTPSRRERELPLNLHIVDWSRGH